MEAYVGIPYNIAPIRIPAKLVFSEKYKVFGSSAQGFCDGLGMARTYVTEETWQGVCVGRSRLRISMGEIFGWLPPGTVIYYCPQTSPKAV